MALKAALPWTRTLVAFRRSAGELRVPVADVPFYRPVPTSVSGEVSWFRRRLIRKRGPGWPAPAGMVDRPEAVRWTFSVERRRCTAISAARRHERWPGEPVIIQFIRSERELWARSFGVRLKRAENHCRSARRRCSSSAGPCREGRGEGPELGPEVHGFGRSGRRSRSVRPDPKAMTRTSVETGIGPRLR